jgi:hypothetical protein
VTKGEAWKNGLINICEEEGESLWRKKYWNDGYSAKKAENMKPENEMVKVVLKMKSWRNTRKLWPVAFEENKAIPEEPGE